MKKSCTNSHKLITYRDFEYLYNDSSYAGELALRKIKIIVGEGRTPLQLCGLDISPATLMYTLIYSRALSDEILFSFAAACAKYAVSLQPGKYSKGCIDAIDAAKKYSCKGISKTELSSIEDAVEDAYESIETKDYEEDSEICSNKYRAARSAIASVLYLLEIVDMCIEDIAWQVHQSSAYTTWEMACHKASKDILSNADHDYGKKQVSIMKDLLLSRIKEGDSI
jgi:hypothetical protein